MPVHQACFNFAVFDGLGGAADSAELASVRCSAFILAEASPAPTVRTHAHVCRAGEAVTHVHAPLRALGSFRTRCRLSRARAFETPRPSPDPTLSHELHTTSSQATRVSGTVPSDERHHLPVRAHFWRPLSPAPHTISRDLRKLPVRPCDAYISREPRLLCIKKTHLPLLKPLRRAPWIQMRST